MESNAGNTVFRLVGDFDGDRDGQGEMSPEADTVTGRNPRLVGTKSTCFKEPITFFRLLLDIVLLGNDGQETMPYMRKPSYDRNRLIVTSCQLHNFVRDLLRLVLHTENPGVTSELVKIVFVIVKTMIFYSMAPYHQIIFQCHRITPVIDIFLTLVISHTCIHCVAPSNQISTMLFPYHRHHGMNFSFWQLPFLWCRQIGHARFYLFGLVY